MTYYRRFHHTTLQLFLLDSARQAAAAAQHEAEVIDISGRVGDQLYDQYADAAVRAVGD